APDNLKSAVFKADRFDPGLNRTYAEMASHYGTAILPARPYMNRPYGRPEPRDAGRVVKGHGPREERRSEPGWEPSHGHWIKHEPTHRKGQS
ncbi:MAG: hypothetical protein COY86_05650, partial [Rhodobacterales bacterium CG_4_10_14_0_8_um_filter_70_9]